MRMMQGEKKDFKKCREENMFLWGLLEQTIQKMWKTPMEDQKFFFIYTENKYNQISSLAKYFKSYFCITILIAIIHTCLQITS